MADVFISYKREERDRCEAIRDRLVALGLDVWFDARLESGSSFDREIEREVKAAKAVLVLWSPASVESRWIRNEADIGLSRGILVAAQIAPCDPPISFRDIHFEVLHERDFAHDAPGWLKILDRIGKLTGRANLVALSALKGQMKSALGRISADNGDERVGEAARTLGAAIDAAGVQTRAGASQPPRRRGVGMALLAGAFGVVLGASGGWFVAETVATRSTSPVRTSTVATAPLPEDAYRVAVEALLGPWKLPGTRSCVPQPDLFLKFGGGVLGVEYPPAPSQDERLDPALADGWLETGGGAMGYRINSAGRLEVRNGRDSTAVTEFVRCED